MDKASKTGTNVGILTNKMRAEGRGKKCGGTEESKIREMGVKESYCTFEKCTFLSLYYVRYSRPGTELSRVSGH